MVCNMGPKATGRRDPWPGPSGSLSVQGPGDELGFGVDAGFGGVAPLVRDINPPPTIKDPGTAVELLNRLLEVAPTEHPVTIARLRLGISSENAKVGNKRQPQRFCHQMSRLVHPERQKLDKT